MSQKCLEVNYNHPSEFIERYVSEHGVARNLFDVRSAADVLFDEDGVAESRKVLCEQAVAEERPSFWRSMRRRFMRNEPAEQSRRMTAAPMPVSDEPSIEDMMSEVQILIEQLRQSGVGEQRHEEHVPERETITLCLLRQTGRRHAFLNG